MKRLIVILVLILGTSLPQHDRYARVETGPPLVDYKTIAALQTSYKPLQLLTLADFPVAPTGSYPNLYEWGNCTWYVAGRKAVPETWGNANTWAARAQSDGHEVSSAPIVGSIAASSAGYYGHVAIVTAVGDGVVQVSEMNVQGLGVTDSAWYPVSFFSYIYV